MLLIYFEIGPDISFHFLLYNFLSLNIRLKCNWLFCNHFLCFIYQINLKINQQNTECIRIINYNYYKLFFS